MSNTIFEIFRTKYLRDFKHIPTTRTPGYKGENPLEQEWCEYLYSLGCGRNRQHKENSIECPDSYHRAYIPHYIHVPEELALKVLALGFLPEKNQGQIP